MSLKIYDLSHTFTQFIPEWPSTPGVNVSVKKFHARDGVYQVEWEGIMHRCTHMDAPIHVTECTPSINDYPLWRLFGTGVAVAIPKGKWGVITAKDLETARPKIQEGDIVMINTGFHHKWARHRRVLRLRLRHLSGGGPVARRQEGQARRLRLSGQRPPHGHKAGRPRPGPDPPPSHR